MTHTAPPLLHAVVVENPESLTLSLPAPRHYLSLLGLGLWLVLWGAGLVFTVKALFGHQLVGVAAVFFLLLWLAGWTIGGLFAIYSLLWMLCGREVITLRGESLTLRREVLGYSRERSCKVAHIRQLRAIPDRAELYELATSLRIFGLAGGKLAFDYLGQIEQFGAGIDLAEAESLAAKLGERLPSGSEQ